ncbi:Aldo/keto reductase [Ephemerocybe angulata]|uniref:Aldo/keto reductase n=1 Tax=Ephemerocybe angulata TaxID=980116 RepID=A0A8H6HZP0_9AGAR|nr:Aldo/keto reductase [Tulosesus angulatus]
MPSLFEPPAPPKSKLGLYRRLSTLAGVHVSPICLGAMSIGDKWQEYGMGSMNKEDSFKLLDGYFDLGGNFIDTANVYQVESSEEFIGEWAEARDIRDQLFIATKYSSNYKHKDPAVSQKIFYGGNSVKALHISVKASLKKLRTDYIDLLYVHYWDFQTSIPEVMQALHGLVLAGKVLYLGVSDTPAWVVSKANQYARDHALTPFSVYQGQWSVLHRSFERDIIPMARDEGMALAPWGVLAAGKIRTDAEEERRMQTGEKGRTIFSQDWLRTEEEKKVSKALEKVAEEIGAKSISAVAIAYVMHKTRFVFPIIGGRKLEQLTANLEALDLTLTGEHLKSIDSVLPFDVGFPTSMIGDGESYSWFNSLHLQSVEYWPNAQPITGKK